MDLKMSKSQEQSEQLQNKELEAIAGGRLNDLVKNLSLRGKVARWAAVAACVGAVSGTLASPVQAINALFGPQCNYRSDFLALGIGNLKVCYANKGYLNVKARSEYVSSGNNEGYLETNKGRIDFTRNGFRNLERGTIVTLIVIY